MEKLEKTNQDYILMVKEIELAIEKDKKKQFQNYEDEINASNYSGNLATGKNSIAIGYKASAAAEDSIALGSNSVADRGNKK